MVSYVAKGGESRGQARPKIGKRRALRERTLLQNARNMRRAPAKMEQGEDKALDVGNGLEA